MGIFTTFIFLCFASVGWARMGPSSSNHFDFIVYGGGKDAGSDTKKLVDAWNSACAMHGPSTVTIPARTTITLNPVSLPGYCNASRIHLRVLGNVVAPGIGAWKTADRNDWITIHNVNGLTIDGSGRIDGQGSRWWDCKAKGRCSTSPITLNLMNCQNVVLRNLKFLNSGFFHIGIVECTGVTISQLSITAPQDSPNTDGIHIQGSQNVEILDSIIGTGDDCISIGTGTSDVNISRITCGPGHGISIGSLGVSDSQAAVSQINISNCDFINTMYGARIKTWQGGSGYARDITFQQLNLTEVSHAIVIDQYYCNGNHRCPNKTAAVEVSNVQFSGLQGTTTNDVAISLACSQSVACTGIFLDDVQLAPATPAKTLTSFCFNAHGSTKNPVVPNVPCLS